jgi:proline dehydrogenase
MSVNRSAGDRRLIALILFVCLLGLVVVSFRFGERWLRYLFLYLSQAEWARDIVSSMSLARRVSRRFVAGETIEEAMTVTQTLNGQGIKVTLDYLGESVTDRSEADASRDEILRLLDRIESNGLDANVSLKLTQLGLRIREDLALENMRLILARARSYDNQVRIDMEESELVDTTLEIYRTLRDEDTYDNVGVVIQAYLYRSEADVQTLIDEGAWVRLCKGAYAEPADIAYSLKGDTDANYARLTRMLLGERALQNGVYLGIATHDEKIIHAAREYAAANGIPNSAYEYQMLYGIRRELQKELVDQGYRLRVYVPYGTAWYPYLVRRLAERPANLWFFVSNLFRN